MRPQWRRRTRCRVEARTGRERDRCKRAERSPALLGGRQGGSPSPGPDTETDPTHPEKSVSVLDTSTEMLYQLSCEVALACLSRPGPGEVFGLAVGRSSSGLAAGAADPRGVGGKPITRVSLTPALHSFSRSSQTLKSRQLISQACKQSESISALCSSTNPRPFGTQGTATRTRGWP